MNVMSVGQVKTLSQMGTEQDGKSIFSCGTVIDEHVKCLYGMAVVGLTAQI